MGKLQGKTVLITGASAGIGRVTALLMAKEGADIILFARREEQLQKVRVEIEAFGGRAITVAGDVSVAADCERAFRLGFEQFGRIDVLVNNAGVSDESRAAVRTSDEIWERNLAINEKGCFLFCREALKYMEPANQGSIVNISSMGGVYAVAGAAYSAAKYAVIGLTRNIAIQYAGTGIRCNAVCPGPVATDMLKPPTPETMDMEMLKTTSAHIDKSVPFIEAEDIAKAVIFFAGDDSARVNGQYLVVDGGRCI